MKKLKLFAASKGLTIVNINYRHCGHGKVYKGFDLIDNERNVHVRLEPCHYTDYSWMCVAHPFSLFHFRNMSEVVKYLNRLDISFTGGTGFKLSA